MTDPIARYHVSADRRTVYAISEKGVWTKLHMTVEEFERQARLMLYQPSDPSPLTKP